MAAAVPFLANDAALLSTSETTLHRPLVVRPEAPRQSKELLEITGVFRGRELTRKERRLTCGIAPVDRLIGGGIVCGRISEIIGNPGAGKTSLAAAFAASITARGEVAAWIDAGGGFDPASITAAGVDLARMLWVAKPANRNWSGYPTAHPDHCADRRAQRPASMVVLEAAEWILTAGGFGLVVIDCGATSDFIGRLSAFTQSAALRLAHGAERSGAAVLVIAPHRMCGTFAALSLMLSRHRACFSQACSGAPVLFDGLTVEARVARNKLGGAGDAATWRALADPLNAAWPESALSPNSSDLPQSAQSALQETAHSALPETAQSAGRRAAAR
jgi:RecA DNA recombination protein